MERLSQRQRRRRPLEGGRRPAGPRPRTGFLPWSRWHRALEDALPPESAVKERNAAITATYARWYRDRPELFKWAGMAAFASHRVVLILEPYAKVQVEKGEVTELEGVAFPTEALKRDLAVLIETNNLIFGDIAWAHAAFIEGGLAALKEEVALRPRYAALYQGFAKIDEGRRLLAAGRREEAEGHIWGGNELLLEHEQWVTLQRQFDKLSADFRAPLSFSSSIDFDAAHDQIDWTYTSFYPFMLTCGAGMLLCTRSLPDITDPRHRWFYVSRRVYPTFKQLDARAEEMKRRIAILAGPEPA